jgi:CHASE2 domain-containing sensor protein
MVYQGMSCQRQESKSKQALILSNIQRRQGILKIGKVHTNAIQSLLSNSLDNHPQTRVAYNAIGDLYWLSSWSLLVSIP